MAQANLSSEDKGLPMMAKWDPEKLAKEEKFLQELETKSLWERIRGYAKLTGPAWLQSAMTLGAGSAAASVMAGASFGYKLLWVQPLAMFFGVIVFAALAKIVLTTGERPYRSFGRELHPILPLFWAIGTITASVIWHFPQYTLAGAAAWDLAQVVQTNIFDQKDANQAEQKPATEKTPSEQPPRARGFEYLVKYGVAACILLINIFTVWNYGSHARGIKLYEGFLRWVIRIVILAFLAVVIYTGINWKELFWGLFGFYIPKTTEGVTVVLGALGAAVGINMTFLYPYSLLAKRWGKHHRGLAKWDLFSSMLVPYTIVTSLIIIAMANTVYEGGDQVRLGLQPVQAAAAFSTLMHSDLGRIILDFGFLAMTCGAISTHMVVCGFTMCEMLGLQYTRARFRLFSLTPSIGILGAGMGLPFWMPILASAICLTMLPIVYFTIFLMVNRKKYLGEAVGFGPVRWVFNILLIAAITVTTIGTAVQIRNRVVEPLRKRLNPLPAAETNAPAQPEAQEKGK
ncbi:MAG: NRAMP family divalent metal transporter [Thermogutta sp.]